MEQEDHIKGLGVLISYFHALEFILRGVLKNQEKEKSNKVNYSTLKMGDSVPEDPMTNYDSLGALIKKYNKIAPNNLKIDSEIITIRDAIAHGRVFSDTQNLPMKLFKFEKPENGVTSVKFAQTLDKDWFQSNLVHIYGEIEKAMKMNEMSE
ncbi:MAG: hypothetical protein JRL30_03230 [Deltaproteobacteria bacterium]|nr:hypothetical protein [Deltaproteobacteria bacterium]